MCFKDDLTIPGEVYRARDGKLGREVAIKVLPEEFAGDDERLARFEREAKLLASLNHPNIASIYGLEESDGVKALVLELVEGPTLAERIALGPIPVEEVLPIARQIAEALEAGHEAGVLHRDLKPANVKLKDDGTVKVLDYGLAKALEGETPSGTASELSQSPTLTRLRQGSGGQARQGTQIGVLLGTAAYMSPEQARGKRLDRRTDVWAFGAVVYEMLTGRAAFAGEDIADILSRVLQQQPDWTRLPASVSPRLRDLLQHCLEKDSRKRRRDAGDVLIDIDDIAKDASVSGLPPAATNARVAWIAAAFLGIAAIVSIGITLRPVADDPEMRLQIVTPATLTGQRLHFALSPDGRSLVYVADNRLWLRRLDKTEALPLAGTEGAVAPFWSPDSRSIGFNASNKLNRIDIGGGPPQALADAPMFWGGTWGKDGTIIFAVSLGGLSRIAASGGDAVPLTRVDAHQHVHLWPELLPDGKHFLYYALGDTDANGIYLGSLDGSEPKRLTAADTAGKYLAPDRVVFVRQGALVARHLDVGRGELTGDSQTIADPVAHNLTRLAGGFSYRPMRGSPTGPVQWTEVNSCGSTGPAKPMAWRVSRRRIPFQRPRFHPTGGASPSTGPCKGIETFGW